MSLLLPPSLLLFFLILVEQFLKDRCRCFLRMCFFFPPSTAMLQVLYKLKTAKVFDRNRSREDKGGGEAADEDPFAIQLMAWCPESRVLGISGVSANVIIYRFSKLEVTTEVVQVGSRKHFLMIIRTHSRRRSPEGFHANNRQSASLLSQLKWRSEGSWCFAGRRLRRRLIPCHSCSFTSSGTLCSHRRSTHAKF